ncbi:hypothetical protein AB0F25_13075 [Streptomyces wedmorensis]|uniref:hypothetical protein n=1 Tax=Streptomyces wedmorensis TaxID=43759 RepID=UPI00341D0D63
MGAGHRHRAVLGRVRARRPADLLSTATAELVGGFLSTGAVRLVYAVVLALAFKVPWRVAGWVTGLAYLTLGVQAAGTARVGKEFPAPEG